MEIGERTKNAGLARPRKAGLVSWMKYPVYVLLLLPLSSLASSGMGTEGRTVLNTKECIANGGISDTRGRIAVCRSPSIQVGK